MAAEHHTNDAIVLLTAPDVRALTDAIRALNITLVRVEKVARDLLEYSRGEKRRAQRHKKPSGQ